MNVVRNAITYRAPLASNPARDVGRIADINRYEFREVDRRLLLNGSLK